MSELILKPLTTGKFMVLQDYEYYLESYDKVFIISKGTITDLASVPFFARWLLPVSGEYNRAAILHDFLIKEGELSRKQIDDIFIAAMKQDKVSFWKINIIRLGLYIYRYFND